MSPMRSIAALLVGFLLAGGPALAETTDPISVKVNMARILRISAPAATVIIGNPGVADITIQDPQTLVLTGRSYGQTNLIVLDSAGNPVADTIVSVVQAPGDLVTVYMGTARQTGFIAMGTDVVAVDAMCARVMGFDPSRIAYLHEASAFLGHVDEARIDMRGEALARFQTTFDVLTPFKTLQISSGG